MVDERSANKVCSVYRHAAQAGVEKEGAMDEGDAEDADDEKTGCGSTDGWMFISGFQNDGRRYRHTRTNEINSTLATGVLLECQSPGLFTYYIIDNETEMARRTVNLII